MNTLTPTIPLEAEAATTCASTSVDAIAATLGNCGPCACLAAFLFMALVAVLPIPAEIPALANGVLFGPVLGTFITWTGSLSGAALSFELGRRYGHPLAPRILSPSMRTKLDRTSANSGWACLLALRLCPVVAFTAVNWGAGLAGVMRRRFLWTTAVGVLPGAILFTATGGSTFELLKNSALFGS